MGYFRVLFHMNMLNTYFGLCGPFQETTNVCLFVCFYLKFFLILFFFFFHIYKYILCVFVCIYNRIHLYFRLLFFFYFSLSSYLNWMCVGRLDMYLVDIWSFVFLFSLFSFSFFLSWKYHRYILRYFDIWWLQFSSLRKIT